MKTSKQGSWRLLLGGLAVATSVDGFGVIIVIHVVASVGAICGASSNARALSRSAWILACVARGNSIQGLQSGSNQENPFARLIIFGDDVAKGAADMTTAKSSVCAVK